MIIPWFVAASLFGPQTPEAERQNLLAPHFKPRPGDLLELDRLSLLENKADPALIKGYIWVTPPVGQCLIVRGSAKKRDKTFCKKLPFAWSIDDLDALGQLKLRVLVKEEWDEGVQMIWNTHYRIGSFVEAGEKESGNFSDIVIKACTATETDGDRSILLESFEGRRWRINLPEFDSPVREVEPSMPNLIVNIDSKKNADGTLIDRKAEDEKKLNDDEIAANKKGAPQEGQSSEEAAGDKNNAKKTGGGSVLGALLSKGYEAEVIHVIKFRLPARGSYQMESGLFTETGAPKGMNGECRYMFNSAPGDPQSGAIECYDTDTMDNVYMHVTCFSQLKARRASRKVEGGKR